MSCNQFCYAITVGNKTKIGLSKNPEARVRTIASQSGFLLGDAAISIIKVKNMRACESACHQYLSDVRVAGEWFAVTHAVAVEAIKMHLDVGCDIAPAIKPSILSMETFTRGLYRAKYNMDVSKAVYELSGPGGTSEDAAIVIVAAAHCDHDILARHAVERSMSNDEVFILNAVYDHLVMVSYDLCRDGIGATERMSKLCFIDTSCAAANALEKLKATNL